MYKRLIYFATKVDFDKLNGRSVVVTKISEDEVKNLIHFAKKQGRFFTFIYNLNERLLFEAKDINYGIKHYLAYNEIKLFDPKDNIIYAKIERDLDALMVGFPYKDVPVTYYLLTVDI